MRASACAALAWMLVWDRTTPFGVPSEPEVNRITAGSLALTGRKGVRQRMKVRAFSASEMLSRSSSSQIIVTPAVFNCRDQTFEASLFDKGAA